ncbi:TrmH family RNA methyltransferase [Stappia indica]|uniref:RNA methyltransferase, TrmH family n=1 Tax=Stappia indica TaxID=538381 RepID=A0A285TBZ5_9HYPH|nr:RNA methyltransferase [Stappia indica]SOC19320.1 RNA methyltransferase, TrmH family [Stappia indica]
MSTNLPRPGQVKQVTSFSNPLVKDIKALIAQRKHRQKSGRFVAEGLKLATDALAAGWEVDMLVLGPEARDSAPAREVAATARARGATILEVSTAVLAAMTRRDNPQMVVGVYGQRLLSASALEKAFAAAPQGVWVALDQVRDPGNLGTIIRTADAVGASGVILVGDTTDPFAVEAVRATMGSLFHVPLARQTREGFREIAARWPGTVVGTHLKGSSDYRTIDYRRPSLLLMGNEQSGLPQEMAEACSALARIPQAGQADSLNLAVATAVMLYEIRRGDLSLT